GRRGGAGGAGRRGPPRARGAGGEPQRRGVEPVRHVLQAQRVAAAAEVHGARLLHQAEIRGVERERRTGERCSGDQRGREAEQQGAQRHGDVPPNGGSLNVRRTPPAIPTPARPAADRDISRTTARPGGYPGRARCCERYSSVPAMSGFIGPSAPISWLFSSAPTLCLSSAAVRSSTTALKC